ncbi:hypothetical protein F4780DRAFT_740351 [Xylariomycetidae sp. FL0641]|nr:hypothetical protein F4780DRAFT_740351 [Xylariomycetidae sp. FL0641]
MGMGWDGMGWVRYRWRELNFVASRLVLTLLVLTWLAGGATGDDARGLGRGRGRACVPTSSCAVRSLLCGIRACVCLGGWADGCTQVDGSADCERWTVDNDERDKGKQGNETWE